MLRQCPALVVAGENDEMFPLERSRALAAGLRNAGLEIVPAGSHGLIIERPAQIVEILRRFLDPLVD